MSVSISDAELRHIDSIVKIENECFSLPWTREGLLAYLPDETHRLLVAEDLCGEVLGYVGLMYVLDEGYISNVAVSPKHRRRGIGSALIDGLIDAAEKLSLAFLTLEVRETNFAAIELYKSKGFAPVGIRKNYYDFPKENAILMTRFFSEDK